MDTDPAIMDAGRNPFRPVTFDNVLKDNNPADGTAAKQPSKSNSAFINKMKISGPLKMKGLKTKAFFRTDRSSLLPTSEAAKPAPPAAAPASVGAGSRSSRADSSSTTLDEEEDSWFSSPSSGAESFRQSWSSKTKAMFSSGVPKFNPVVAALKKSQLSKTASTSSFEAVSKLDSTSSHMDVASESSVHEVANMSVSSVAEESDKSLDGESDCSDVSVGLRLLISWDIKAKIQLGFSFIILICLVLFCFFLCFFKFLRGDIKDQDTDRSKEKDTGSGQKERFPHFLLSWLGLSKGRVRGRVRDRGRVRVE